MRYRPYEQKPSGKYVAPADIFFMELEEAFDAASALARKTMHRVDLRDRDGKVWCGFDFRLSSDQTARSPDDSAKD